jgi:hypothetical protein
MAMMKWSKPSAETIAYFERIAPGPPIEARSMFGMPARFLNGHMLVSLFGDAFMLHLSAADRLECIAAGARPFAPMGRSAKEYVEITPGHFDDHTLKVWIARGMRYLGSLPPKLKVPVPARVEAERAGKERSAAAGARRAATSAKAPAAKRAAASAPAPSQRRKSSAAGATKPRALKARTSRAVKAGARRSAAKPAAPKAPSRRSGAPAKAKRAPKKAKAKRR